MIKKFSATQPEPEVREPDRMQLKEGQHMIITGFVMQPSKKYPDGVAKINGYDLVTKVPLKFWTTARAIINQLANMAESEGIEAGLLKNEVKVKVIAQKGEKNTYLSFADPDGS